MTTQIQELDGFDVLLNDALHTVANPELPQRIRVNVQTRVWVREMSRKPNRPAVVFAPEVFLARMQPKRDAKSTATALLVHAAAIALLFWAVESHSRFIAAGKVTAVTELTPPPPMAPAKDLMGGGGGQRGATPATKGQLPKFAATQITPPKAPPMVEPKIRMPNPTLEMQKDLKMANVNMPNFGDPKSPLSGVSMGNGTGTGIGSGSGSGLGSGSGGNYGGGIMHVGGGVSKPELVYSIEPEFSEEARKAKFMGVVTVGLVVDTHGLPQSIHIVRGVGMGLDDKALAAVKQYRFRPAMLAGKPVPVEVNVEVNFQIF